MAARRRHAYMLPMSIRSVLLIVVLLALLIAAAAISIHTWNAIGADPSSGGGGGKAMSGVGIAALIGGGLGTLALGVGLMFLVFFSARRGYDDAADQKARPPEDR
jgi:hypothetical protein